MHYFLRVKITAETNDAADLEGLQRDSNEEVGKYFARVSVVLTKLQKHDVTISKREIRQHVFSGYSPQFPADMNSFARKKSV